MTVKLSPPFAEHSKDSKSGEIDQLSYPLIREEQDILIKVQLWLHTEWGNSPRGYWDGGLKRKRGKSIQTNTYYILFIESRQNP